MTTPDASNLPIKVIVHDDSDDVTIEWDETHPLAQELRLEEWTREQWLEAFEKGLDSSEHLDD